MKARCFECLGKDHFVDDLTSDQIQIKEGQLLLVDVEVSSNAMV